MNIFNKIFLLGKEFLFPGTCALCGCSLINPAEIRFSLCDKCRKDLTAAKQLADRDNKCDLCGKPLISEINTCLPCRNGDKRSYERLWVLYPYIGKYRRLLTTYKFGNNLALADYFAEKIMDTISAIPELNEAIIVPVPPRPGKIKDNGWDQVDYLVKRLKKIKGCPPVFRCLKRKKSKVQKQLSRTERMNNLKGRIFMTDSAAAKISPEKPVIVIDDVITTGSTIEMCSAVLKEKGFKNIYGVCLFFD